MLWFKWFLYWKWNYVLWLRWYYLCNFVKILWSIRNQYIRSMTNSIISKLPPMKINDCNRKLMRLWFLKCWSLKRNQFNIKNKHFSRQQFTWVLAGVRCCKVKLINNYDDVIIKIEIFITQETESVAIIYLFNWWTYAKFAINVNETELWKE